MFYGISYNLLELYRKKPIPHFAFFFEEDNKESKELFLKIESCEKHFKDVQCLIIPWYDYKARNPGCREDIKFTVIILECGKTPVCYPNPPSEQIEMLFIYLNSQMKSFMNINNGFKPIYECKMMIPHYSFNITTKNVSKIQKPESVKKISTPVVVKLKNKLMDAKFIDQSFDEKTKNNEIQESYLPLKKRKTSLKYMDKSKNLCLRPISLQYEIDSNVFLKPINKISINNACRIIDEEAPILMQNLIAKRSKKSYNSKVKSRKSKCTKEKYQFLT